MIPVPPLADELIVPLLPPLQLGATKLALLNDTAVGWVIETTVVVLQPLTSVPVIVYD